MKTKHWVAIPATVSAMGIMAISPCAAQGNSNGNGNGNGGNTPTIPSAPKGEISAYPSIVQTGTKPTLTWNILYPSNLSGTNPPLFVNPPGTLVPNTTVYATVQIVGTGITACSPTRDPLIHPVDVRVSFNRGTYSQIFYGTPSQVVPSKKLYIKKLFANQTLDFGASYVINGVNTPFYTSLSSNLQVVSLVNGATIPTTFPLYQSSNLKSYLRPYLNATGTVNIGPLSVLVLMELGNTNRSATCFDVQDVVLLVTISTGHPNNGHGNNLDGVDSSNPGNGHGGPNGMVDPSGGVDDEIR